MRNIPQTVFRIKTKYGIKGPLALMDYYRICDGENIFLVDSPEMGRRASGNSPGFTFKLNGARFIYIRSLFESEIDLHVFGHELGHILLGHTAQDARAEREADLFAAELLS